MLVSLPIVLYIDFAIWSSSSENHHHRISYFIEDKNQNENMMKNRLFIYIGDDKRTEYMLTIHPDDIYHIEYRNDYEYKEWYDSQQPPQKCPQYVKLRLYRPCTISKLAITPTDDAYELNFLPPNHEDYGTKWTNQRKNICTMRK